MKAREIKKLRRAKEHRAKNAADNRFGQKLVTAMSGCSNRVLKAVSSPSVRDVKEEPGAMCLPDVAIFAAGYRKSTKSIYQAR